MEQENNGPSRSGSANTQAGRFTSRPPLAVVLPGPTQAGRTSPTPSPLETRRGLDIAKTPAGSSTLVDDKLKALRNFRKARGLCFTCGERWGPGHTCASTVQLHVVEEMVDMLSPPTSPDPSPTQVESLEDVVAGMMEFVVLLGGCDRMLRRPYNAISLQ